MGHNLKRSVIALGSFVLVCYGFLAVQLMGAGAGEMSADHPDIVQIESLLGGAEINILQSYSVGGNWSGDIDRGFAGTTEEGALNSVPYLEYAIAGDQLSHSLASAVSFLAEHLGAGQANWFPRADEILTADYRIQSLSVESQGEGIDSSRLLIIRPADGMLYYGWVKF